MDWRNNTWVGIGAAGLLVLVIIVMVWYISSGGAATPAEGAKAGLQFECEACESRFRIELVELENYETYKQYMKENETAVLCKNCGEIAAYRVYYCPECDKWYRYTRAQGSAQVIVCPQRHPIPEEHQ